MIGRLPPPREDGRPCSRNLSRCKRKSQVGDRDAGTGVIPPHRSKHFSPTVNDGQWLVESLRPCRDSSMHHTPGEGVPNRLTPRTVRHLTVRVPYRTPVHPRLPRSRLSPLRVLGSLLSNPRSFRFARPVRGPTPSAVTPHPPYAKRRGEGPRAHPVPTASVVPFWAVPTHLSPLDSTPPARSTSCPPDPFSQSVRSPCETSFKTPEPPTRLRSQGRPTWVSATPQKPVDNPRFTKCVHRVSSGLQ